MTELVPTLVRELVRVQIKELTLLRAQYPPSSPRYVIRAIAKNVMIVNKTASTTTPATPRPYPSYEASVTSVGGSSGTEVKGTEAADSCYSGSGVLTVDVSAYSYATSVVADTAALDGEVSLRSVIVTHF